MAANFLADLLALADSTADNTAYNPADDIDAVRRDLRNSTRVLAGAHAIAIRDFGYGRHADAAARRLFAARADLARLDG